MRTIAPKGYNSMAKVVFDVLNYSHPAAMEIVNTYASDYKAIAEGKVTFDTMDEELVAKVVSELLTDEDFVKDLASTNRNLFQRIYDYIIDFLQRKINELWQTDLTPAMKDAIDMLDKDFGKIKSLYETALKSTQNLQTDKGKASEVGGEMYAKSGLTSDEDGGKIKTNMGGVYNVRDSEQESQSSKLGRFNYNGKTERFDRVGKVGRPQQEEQNSSYTKRIHRSGVSAETVTSSGLTAEQHAIKEQNKLVGYSTEFYTNARYNGSPQNELFMTDNSIYYPDSDFEHKDIVIKSGTASFSEKRFHDLNEEFSVPVGGQLNGDYAKGYVAYISPSDFLSLTTTNESQIVNEAKSYGKIDVDALANNNQTLHCRRQLH